MAGFKAWLGLGYCVRRGERALRILAPVPLGKRTAKDAGADADEQGAKRSRVTFKATAVFDRSQVDPLPDCEPTPLEPPCEPLTGDSHAHLLEALRAFCADELGYCVEVLELSGSVGGWCDHAAREIVLDARVAPNAQLRTLIHESAHALGVSYRDYPRAQAEVIVDCTVFWGTLRGLARGGSVKRRCHLSPTSGRHLCGRALTAPTLATMTSAMPEKPTTSSTTERRPLGGSWTTRRWRLGEAVQ